MGYSKSQIRALFHLTEAVDVLQQASTAELNELRKTSAFTEAIHWISKFFRQDSTNRILHRSIVESPFDPFEFDHVMNSLKTVVLKQSTERDTASDIDWLLRILLESPRLFDSVREVDNFLANMTGISHSTKSTGRD